MEKLLSVIVPVYNASEWVSETLDSLIGQTYMNLEILCVDDGSSDNSKDIIRAYSERDARVRLIEKENGGVSSARNRGLEEARGEYIAFLDADDCVELEAYKEMIERLEADGSDIVFCRFVRFWPNGKTLYTVEENLPCLAENPHDIKYFLLSTPSRMADGNLYTKDIHGAIWRSIFRSDILQNNQIRFHTDLRFAEDQIFMLEYLAHCQKGSYIPEVFIRYRGWTKPWVYRSMYDNMMALCRYQCHVIEANTYYSAKEKKSLAGYCKQAAFLAIINQEFMFKPDAEKTIRQYYKNREFVRLNSFYNFRQKQKYKQKWDVKRLLLFVLLKMRLFLVVRKSFPNKKYS